MTAPALADWSNFYVITGSAAAGLTGLTFVVIALAADVQRVNPAGLHVFITPTIVHFSFVLGLAAFACVPHAPPGMLSAVLAAAGAAGFSYAMLIGSRIRGNPTNYMPVLEDWIWNAILPCLAYAMLLAAAALWWRHAEVALYGMAAASLLLLFIGIHNAWDIATWMTLRRQDPSGPDAGGG